MRRARKKNEDVAGKLTSSELENPYSTSTGSIQQHVKGAKE